HAYDQAVLHTGTIVQVEEHVKVNSEQRSFALTIFPVYDTQGRISHIGSIATDITELLQVEAAYRSLVEQSLQGLVILQDERVVFANEAVVTMTGHSMSELFACTIDTFSSDVHPDDLEMLYEHYQDVLHQRSPPEKNTVRHIRYRFRRADGELRWFESAATPIIYRGNDALQIASLDVTERKSIEDAMHAERATLQRQVEVQTADLRHTNTALRRAMRVKDEFLAMMSHELRTPLNTILGMTEALRDEVYGKLNERQQHGLQMIETSGQNLLALINDILDVTRIEAGQVQLNLQEVLIHEVCRSALRMVESAARHKQIDVSFEIAPSARVIRADVSRLKQILINLLSNAVKFTPEKGRIGLDISGDMPQQCISFVVWDTGIGIPPDRMDQLFKPFVQIDSSLSRNFEGTGLGLTLVRSLIELHGGSVSVESTPGSGSRFTVTLPMYANTQHVVHPDTQTSLVVANGSKNNAGATDDPRPHILLVEDNPSNSRIIEDYLNIYGYRVSTVTNGMAALTSITTLTPRLVLLDIQIPDIDGLEVLRRIRTDSRVASLPIIALTAHGLPDDHERLLAAGATASLSKPISLKQMMHAIASNLS
ncbi:MAG: response regulator, partial [Chloroflexaceae bacterium]|nr:response regulator [Chloroflexaceae bacterium]